ncbi:MAG: phasin family protein [Deltaproteobacteria bacterium]|nr:phasin family protein [Deltaproteobacteria bacterium]
MATKTATFPRLARLQESIRSVQAEGEKLLARLRKDAGKLVSRDQRKVLEALVDQARAIRSDIQKRTEKALRAIEARGKKLLSQIEARTKKGVGPLVRRLSLPSKDEVERLARRLSALEKRVDEILSKSAPPL